MITSSQIEKKKKEMRVLVNKGMSVGEAWEEVTPVLERAFEMVPFQVSVVSGLAKAKTETGNLEGALKDIRKLIYMDAPRKVEHRIQLAEVLAQKGDLQTAKAEVLALLESMPYYWGAQELLLRIVDQEGVSE